MLSSTGQDYRLEDNDALELLRKVDESVQMLIRQVAIFSERNKQETKATDLFRESIVKRVEKLEAAHTVMVNKDELKELTTEVEGMKKAIWSGLAVGVFVLPFIVMLAEHLLTRIQL